MTPPSPTGDGENPYAPPATDEAVAAGAGEMRAPTSVPLVFGVLSITFAAVVLSGFLLVGSIGLVVSQVASRVRPAAAQADAARPSSRRRMDWPSIICGLSTVSVFPAALLAIGVGQLRRRRWALRATRLWSLLGAGSLIAHTIIALSLWLPGRELVPAWIPLLPYPVLQLVFFSRPRVTAAMCR